MRRLALVTLALLLGYYILRLVAQGCSGSGCDWFIPFSLLLPSLVLIASIMTGMRGIRYASGTRSNRRWTVPFVVVTLIAVVGPLASLLLFRDSPDRFVPLATALVLPPPLLGLIYSFRWSSADGRRGSTTRNPS
jgi:hypothetical protein